MKIVLSPFLLALLATNGKCDALSAGFLDPPLQARPLVFWQWVNGNVSEAGIRLDLQWMQRAGVAGALMFDIGFRRPPVPQFVDRRVGFGTPAWESAVHVAAAEAQRLGLSLGAQSSGGWSVSGGPEVRPEDGMKKLEWRAQELEAPWQKSVAIAALPGATGPFGDLAADPAVTPVRASGGIAVLAWRLPDVEQQAARPRLRDIPSSAQLEDGSYRDTLALAPDAHGDVLIFAEPAPGTRIRSLTLAVPGPWPRGAIEASDDGAAFRPVIELPANAAQPAPVRTFALTVPARAWRVRFSGLTAPLAISEARFDVAARIDRFEEKAGFGVTSTGAAPQATEPGTAIDPDDIVDVTAFAQEGRLDWTPPAAASGRWVVVTFGWSLTGRLVVPATDESRGLEIDKLDAGAVRRFATSFYGRYRRAIGAAGTLGIALTDSWEAGQQNWTPDMLAEFRKRRGYDLRPWLPVLTGRIVGSVERSERVLADFRRTIADLIADSHYAVLTEVAHENGMTSYAEAAGTGQPTNVDGLQAKGRVDVPMGEYWYYDENAQPDPDHLADVREAASAAHIYGKPLVAAEALTTRGELPFALGPRQLRPIVDRFFAEGINRIVLHTSVHQPFTPESGQRRPGITLRQYGQHFTRNETWAEDAHAWTRYLARTSQLLQQGKPVADIAIFVGDDVPFKLPANSLRPQGYDYDFLDAEVLARATVRKGRVVAGSSASFGLGYRVVVTPPQARIVNPATRAKLSALAAAGVPVVESVRAAVAALEARKIIPDVVAPEAGTLHWAHRTGDDLDVYFVTNQLPLRWSGVAQFRARRAHVEIWNAVTGAREPARHAALRDVTEVSLDLDPYESRFIVFRGPAPPPAQPVPLERTDHREVLGMLATFQDPWDVEFLDVAGTPRLQMQRLTSWTESADPAIRYYSGRARYTQSFEVRAQWLEHRDRIELHLGRVAELARVLVNGREVGVSWTNPDRVVVGDALEPGTNRLEIVVTNYWANRMIGDLQPGAARTTFAPIQPFTAASPLRPAGLFGPVQLLKRSP